MEVLSKKQYATIVDSAFTKKVVARPVSGVAYLCYFLQFVIDSLMLFL